MKQLLLLAFLLFISTAAYSQMSLVGDFNLKQGYHNMPDRVSTLKDLMLFAHADTTDKVELWASDGTAGGTKQLTNFNHRLQKDADPELLTQVNGKVFFKATSDEGDNTLCITDGTEAGTKKVLRAFMKSYGNDGSGIINHFTSFKNKLYFSFYKSGYYLWQSDGSTEGTNSLVALPYINGLAVAGDHLYIAGTTGSDISLWKSDGSSNGTKLVRSFTPLNKGEIIQSLIPVGEILYFTTGGVIGVPTKMWRTNGTAEGTVEITSHFDNPDFRFYSSAVVDGKLFLTLANSNTSYDLWVIAENYKKPEKLLSAARSISKSTGSLKGALFFGADDGTNGQELWISDGTVNGTSVVRDINNGKESANPDNFTSFNDDLYFIANNGLTGVGLWRINGSSGYVSIVKDFKEGEGGQHLSNLSATDNFLLFKANITTEDKGLWRTDGTEAGTERVKRLGFWTLGSSPQFLTAFKDELYFAGDRGYGNGIFKFGHDLKPKEVFLNPDYLNYRIVNLNKIEDKLVFLTDNRFSSDTVKATKLWVSDGTSEGTTLIKDFPSISFSDYTIVGNRVLFYVNTKYSPTRLKPESELWSSDGTPEGTTLVRSFYTTHEPDLRFKILNDYAYFIGDDGEHGEEVWRTDGTVQGTTLVMDINANVSDRMFYVMSKAGDYIYFRESGSKIWRTDGITTEFLFDMRDVGISSAIFEFHEIGNKLAFIAVNTDGNTTLYVTDGTIGGTKKAYTCPPSDGIKQIIGGSEKLYFQTVNNWSPHATVYALDAVTMEPTLIQKFTSHPGYYTVSILKVLENVAYYFHNDEVYRTNGTVDGTKLVMKLDYAWYPSIYEYSPGAIKWNNNVFLPIYNTGVGTELWRDGNMRPFSSGNKINIEAGGTYTFNQNDFKYFDADGDAFEYAEINTLPNAGTILLNNVEVKAGQRINASDLANLSYSQAPNSVAPIQASIKYLVNDGYSYSQPATITITLKADQNITFNESNVEKVYQDKFDLKAIATSNLPVNFRLIAGQDIAEIAAGNEVLVKGVGEFSIEATQSGDELYKPALPIIKTYKAVKAQQEISFESLPTEIKIGDKLKLNASATSGLPVNYSSSDHQVATIEGDELVINGVGNVTITATQGGNQNYEPANNVAQQLSIVVNKTLAFPNPVVNNEFVIEIKEPAELQIATITGIVLLKRKINAGQNVITLNNASAGTYIVTIMQGDTLKETFKLQKL
ncbi:ELWxxDGT repeat protein [Pontibacter fetidus]|uniref:T9SS type A sorting domain-containing protein n=1 Tax=Pontibacter fetidus TaxID=2700082 RepID=A0A6B2H7N6_9BACT|nr:ELWxxDGT repeat protein [Pontibacter fetidus]NDK56956.1 T9SS type A sorting domain-containing protein [Pontibacter fetidus]